MIREAEFAAARMRHSVWSQCHDEVMAIPVKNKRRELVRKTVALIRADREESKMDVFLQGCFVESREAANG